MAHHPDGIRVRKGGCFWGTPTTTQSQKLSLPPPPVQANIERETNTLADVVEAAKAENTAVVLLIGPNKSTLYPEYLPNQIHPSARRYVTYFTERLEGIADLTVVDPVEDLLRNKKSAGFLYYRTDTHWNDKGAFLAFSVLANRLGWPVPDVSFEIDTPYSGDLIKISELEDFPTTAGDSWQIKWASEPDLETKPLTNQPETSFGRAEIVMNSSSLSKQTVWVIGDSFTDAIAPYIDATFEEVHYLGHWNEKLLTLPQDLASAEEKPDIVIVIRVERSF